MRLGLRVEAPGKVGLVLLLEALAAHGVLLVVLVDAARREDGAVDAAEEAAVGEVEGADDVAPYGSLLVVLAPVDVGTAGDASGVEDVGGLDAVELGEHGLAVLHADRGAVDLLALRLEEGREVAGDPALAAPDEIPVGHVGVVVRRFSLWRVGLLCEGEERNKMPWIGGIKIQGGPGGGAGAGRQARGARLHRARLGAALS